MKRFLCLLLALSMILSTMPYSAFASSVQEDQEPEVISYSIVRHNPIYSGEDADTSTESKRFACDTEEDALSSGRTFGLRNKGYATTVEEGAAILRENMVNRQTTVEVKCGFETFDVSVVEAIFDEAVKHTGVATEGDSLNFVWEIYGCNVSGTSNNPYLTLEYQITYYTTAEQEAELTEAVEILKGQLDLDGKSDYEIVKGIYDYMTANIAYDFDNLNDDSHTMKYSAYAALVNKTSVCQGYATLFYRLALEYGVDARVISGIGNGGEHAWNIVKLGDKYYNLDATWDSTWDDDKSNHDFFLKNDENFVDHARNPQYLTDAFYTAYPMGEVDYVPGEDGDEVIPEPPIMECSHEKTELIPGIDATHTSTGLTEGTKCVICGETIILQEVVPMLDPVTFTYNDKTQTLTFHGDGMIGSLEEEIEYP